MSHVDHSTLTGLLIKNSPFRTFSILSSTGTALSRLTLGASAGFDLSRNNGVVTTGNTIQNQDNCLAMQSSADTTFRHNSCAGGHGISIDSIGGAAVGASDTILGPTVANIESIHSDNRLRVKTIVGLKGLVTGTDNTLANVKHAVVMHSGYSSYTGTASSEVGITDITIDRLTATATSPDDVAANPTVVANWKGSRITVACAYKSPW